MFSGLNIKIGLFLATRQLRRSSPWTTFLIIFIMVLTFLNLVVVSGILIGLLQGAIDAVRTRYTGDVIVSTLDDKTYIERSPDLLRLIATIPGIEEYSPRFRESATFEANYETRQEFDKPNITGAQIVGIDPVRENAVTGLSEDIIEGEYLAPGDFDKVVVGGYLLKQYFPVETPGFATLENVGIGSKIRMKVGDVTREVTVKGIIKSKVDEIALRVFMLDSQLKPMIGRGDGNVDEIAIRLKPATDPTAVRDRIKLNGFDEYAKIQTFEDGQPKFLKDMIQTFNMLGAGFSSFGLVVASITIFIVIFINALTRRKFIGILKGIGVSGRAIEISYVFQSMFYALIGSGIGLALVYFALIPFFNAHPINFPFSDGILVAPIDQTLFRVGLLVFFTVVAGYLPAWMIIRKNTLDSILGRN